MKATLEEITVSVDLGEGDMILSVKPSDSRKFVAHLAHSYMLPNEVRKQHLEVPLGAQEILAAIDELRAKLKPLGQVGSSLFWYILGEPRGDIGLMIDDLDPVNHTSILFCPNNYFLSKKDPRSAAFFNAIAKSPYCEGKPDWQDSTHILAKLKPRYAQANRLEAYRGLLEQL